VVITLDALRADSVGYAGHPIIKTPRLDALAAESVVFTQEISSFFGTTASMPSLMSGLYPNLQETDEWTVAVWHGFSDLNDPDETKGVTRNLRMLAEVMQERGYLTGCFTTNPNLTRWVNFTQGCDHYEGFGDFYQRAKTERRGRLDMTYPPADVVVDRVIEWLQGHAEEPVYLWLHLMEPHSPYLPPAPFDRLPERSYMEHDDLTINKGLYRQIANQQQRVPRPLHEALGVTPAEADAFTEHVKSLYDGEIRFGDQETGRLVDFLGQSGMLERTLLVVTADHGEEMRDHGMFIHHGHHPAMEELIRIPLMMRIPLGAAIGDGRSPVRRRIDQQVRMIDVMPTVLDLLGMADEIHDMDGVSLRPLIEGRSMEERPAFVGSSAFNVLRTSRFKYRRIKRRLRSYPPGESLFDIVADPLETTDVSAEHPEVLRRLREAHDAVVRHLVERSETMRDPGVPAPELDAETRERLENLGYLDPAQ
jgi:arylsulfatase A-like enzyme